MRLGKCMNVHCLSVDAREIFAGICHGQSDSQEINRTSANGWCQSVSFRQSVLTRAIVGGESIG